MFQAPETDTDPTAAASGGFKAPEDDLDPPKSIEGFLDNALGNAGRILNPIEMAKGLGSTFKEGLYDIPKAAAESSVDLLKGTTKAVMTGELPSRDDIAATPILEKTRQMTEPIAKDPLGYAYKNPLDAAALVTAPLMAFSPGEAAVAGNVPHEPIPEIPEVPPEPPGPKGLPIEAREETIPPNSGTKVPLEETTPPPAAPKPPISETIANQAVDKAKEVRDYISKGYEGYAKKPGAAASVADYVQEKSQMMAAQQMGFTPLQNRQLGVNPTEQMANIRAIGQYGIDSGMVSPTTGLRGMIKINHDLLEQAGKTLGDLRKEADALRNPKVMPIDPLQEIRSQLDGVFARGARSGETGSYQKALETVEDAQPTFQGMAKASTELNHAANEANRLNQPHGAYTDVANVLSRVENDRIRQLLGPEKTAQYDQALKEFGVNKKISEALRRKVGGEVKRLGPGSLVSNLVQKGMDEIGYRSGAKIANKLSSAITKNPSIARTLPSVFKEFVNQAEDAVRDATGMAEGGVVPEDVKRWVSAR